ncbi:TPA: EfeM/EfeO family lipoprotein, partial [Mannheimia haemolytica]|nr:EfeM/EfeO family lipoprotein [Mannheimia haemolytica]
KTGYDYVPYNKLSKADIKALAEAVNQLGEPLAQLGVLLNK